MVGGFHRKGSVKVLFFLFPNTYSSQEILGVARDQGKMQPILGGGGTAVSYHPALWCICTDCCSRIPETSLSTRLDSGAHSRTVSCFLGFGKQKPEQGPTGGAPLENGGEVKLTLWSFCTSFPVGQQPQQLGIV